MTITPTTPDAFFGLDSTRLHDAVVFPVTGTDWARLQVSIEGASSWPASLVITVTLSADGIRYAAPSAGAVTITGAGNQAAVTTTGAGFLKLAVTTVSATAANIYPALDAGVTNG